MPVRGSAANLADASPRSKKFWNFKNDVVFYLEIKPAGSWGGEHALIRPLRESGDSRGRGDFFRSGNRSEFAETGRR